MVGGPRSRWLRLREVAPGKRRSGCGWLAVSPFISPGLWGEGSLQGHAAWVTKHHGARPDLGESPCCLPTA